MLDRLTESPIFAIGFIVLVIYLGGIYFLNRERSKVQRLKGPRRFQPDWGKYRGGSRRRRRKKSGSFQPDWSGRTQAREPKAGKPPRKRS